MYAYWTLEEIEALESVASYEEAAEIALQVLARMKTEGEIAVVCGPMGTGGLGSRERNMERFMYAIERARSEGHTVFNQIPFQKVIGRISEHYHTGVYDWNILEVFYRRVFESGHITKTYFLPGWEESTGASWERRVVSDLGLTVEEYPLAWLEESYEQV